MSVADAPMPAPLPAFYDDLDLTWSEAWSLLSRGTADRRSPAHTPVLATIGSDGAPQARTVVLRAVDRAGLWVQVHTDRRSGKWAELGADPRAALHVYSAPAKIQLRLAATAERLADGPEADAAWSASRPMSRHCYTVVPPPGAPVDRPGAVPFDAAVTAGGRMHFAALRLHVTALEWLYLEASGHRRARFVQGPDGRFTGTWLVP